jgi:hypothetical protein
MNKAASWCLATAGIVLLVILLLPTITLSRSALKAGGSGLSTLSPDGTTITYNSVTSSVVTPWGTFSRGPTFSGIDFYFLLNGRYAAQLQNYVTPPAWGTGVGGQQLTVDWGGNMYAFINGDTGWTTFENYEFIANGSTVGGPGCNTRGPAPPGTCPVTGTGYVFPTYSPPYTNSPNGTSTTTCCVTNQDGNWGISGGALTLNGVKFGENRGDGNTNNSSPPNLIFASSVQINSNGVAFAQLSSDSTWRSMAGLQANPSTGPTTSPVPVSLTFAPSTTPHVAVGSPAGTVIVTLTMLLSDGSMVVPSTGEVTTLTGGAGTDTTTSYSSPSLLTTSDPIYSMPNLDGLVLQVTRNGTTFSIGFSISIS